MAEKQNKSFVLQSQAKFLSDRPLTAETKQNDKFGHSGIAENLKQIILTCPTPFTIGLFGKWGTGKTSILNLLKGVLSSHRLPVVTFDVWKHEGDAFRRTFLKEVVAQLKNQGLPNGFKLSERIDTSISITKKVKKIDRITYGVFVSLIVIMGLVGLLFWNDKNILRQYYSIVTSGSLVTVLLIWLFNRIVITEDLTKTKDRFEDPHEFEEQFFNIVKQSNTERLLITIDNLDRCTHEHAVKLLTTIKTFLANDADANPCIFLITCDDEAIRKHLRCIYNTSKHESYDVDEFLRKFFNTSLALPDFIDTELHSYTEELLAETTIPQFNNSDVAHVITTAFRDNPRQIKQFINILIAHFLMAQNREVGSNPMIVPKGVITDNVAFLAKFLVIRQKFSLAHKAITDDYLPFKEWDKIKINRVDFKNFLNSTKTISIDNIEPFIHLKQSREELNIQGYREIKLALTDNNPKVVKEMLESFEATPSKVKHFYRFLLRLIERNERRKAILLNIIGCFLEAFDHSKLNLNKYLYVRIGSIVNDEFNGLKKNLPEFNPEIIFTELLPKCNENDRSGIIDGYISYLSMERNDQGEPATKDIYGKGIDSTIEREHACKLLKELVGHKEWLNKKTKAKINKAIEDTYYPDIEILSLFQSDVENQKDFISEQTLSKFVSTFSTDDVEDIESIDKKIHLLLRFNAIIKSQATESILVKLQELLDTENKLPVEQVEEDEIGRKENSLFLIEDVLNTLADEIKNNKLQTQLSSFADKLSQGINALGNWNDRKLFIFSCLLIVDLLEDPHKSEIDQLIQSFFTNADLNSIQFVFGNNKLRKNSKTQLISRYPKVFKTRVIADQSIFDFLYPIATKQVRPEWLVALINSDPKRAVEKLQSLGYKTDDNKNIVQALLQKVTAVAVQEKTPIYKTINEMKCANDAELKNSLASQIQDLLKTTDAKSQEVGYDTFDKASSYLSEAARRDVAQKIIDWLRSPALSNPYQPNSTKSVILNWDILAQTPKNDYIYFIFHNLIMPRTNIDAIRLGFEVLSKVNVLYEGNTKTYFDDTLSGIENETREDIKATVVDGFILLKLQKLNKESTAFWTKLQKFQDDSESKAGKS